MGKPTAQAVSALESIDVGSEPRELKYLSTWRKEINRDSASSDERTRNSPKVVYVLVERSGKAGHSG